MNANHPIARFVHGFFQDYLAAQRGLSPNTILAYRDCLKLFLRFVSEQVGRPVDKLILEEFDKNLVTAFLDHLETNRGNSTQTRNIRLAALRAFFRYVAAQEPMLLAPCQRICEIPNKRTPHKTIDYLEDKEMSALLESVDPNSRNGRRDYALVLFLYNTGARGSRSRGLDDRRFATSNSLPGETHRQGPKRKTLSALARNRDRAPRLLERQATRCTRGARVSQCQRQTDHAFRDSLHRAPVRGQSRKSMSFDGVQKGRPPHGSTHNGDSPTPVGK